MELNWVREFNKLMSLMNEKESYFSGGKFISLIREFDNFHPDYYQYIEYRQSKGLSTSRKDYFYDILMNFSEETRKKIFNRFYEEIKDMKGTPKQKHEEGLLFWNSQKSEQIEETKSSEDLGITYETIDNPKVFISYSWDDEDHKQWVLDLSKRLFENGVEVILDRYELKPGKNMIHFMEQAVPKADKVLTIFTPNFKLKAESRSGGVGFEYSIMNSELYNSIADNKKFIPILRRGSFSESIPNFIQQFIAIDMVEDSQFESKLSELLLAIYDKPQVEKPQIGKSPFN
ncbi:toll/interleukin-1 receptor domain-containing protein [Flammeovirga sp. SubArs3]|uniref:toll/interleukin-1 receptor domain-containing protein n=1 Tax=Flammeovirga sp. SubArs3 TaxID=2995316 RepID=UPI00248CC8A1|nr:toll/interleukin-1 receptor domain-containing protein [Flammeovirga sp. SubArs3]